MDKDKTIVTPTALTLFSAIIAGAFVQKAGDSPKPLTARLLDNIDYYQRELPKFGTSLTAEDKKDIETLFTIVPIVIHLAIGIHRSKAS